MRALLYGDTFPRLVQDWREHPGKWTSRLVFLLGPWVCLWMVDILNENDVFEDLAVWQVLMNMIFYYSIFAVLRMLLGRNRRAAAIGAVLSFTFGLVNHYVLRFRGRILFPADITGWRTAANVAGGFDYSVDMYMTQAAILLSAYLFLVFFCVPQKKTGQTLSPGLCGYVGNSHLLLLRFFLYGNAPCSEYLHPAVGHPAQRLSAQLLHSAAVLLGG